MFVSAALVFFLARGCSPAYAQQQCMLLGGRDCPGKDFHQEATATPEHCCNLCRQTSGCRAFTHATGPLQRSGSTCYLKLGCPWMVKFIQRPGVTRTSGRVAAALVLSSSSSAGQQQQQQQQQRQGRKLNISSLLTLEKALLRCSLPSCS